MPKLRVIEGRGRKRVLVYGMRLFEPGTVARVNRGGEILLADGHTSRLTVHVIEGSLVQIRKQLEASIDAFFELQEEMR